MVLRWSETALRQALGQVHSKVLEEILPDSSLVVVRALVESQMMVEIEVGATHPECTPQSAILDMIPACAERHHVHNYPCSRCKALYHGSGIPNDSPGKH